MAIDGSVLVDARCLECERLTEEVRRLRGGLQEIADLSIFSASDIARDTLEATDDWKQGRETDDD